MIRVFPPNETEFVTNGLGRIRNAKSAIVKEELNGGYELHLQCSDETDISNELYEEEYILFCKPNPYSKPQAFRIYSIKDDLKGGVDVAAKHISYDLSHIPVNAFNKGNVEKALTKYTASQAFAEIPKNIPVKHKFIFESKSTGSKTASFQTNMPVSAKAILGSDRLDKNFLNLYGGDLEYDNFKVIYHDFRGDQDGASVSYGVNMTNLAYSKSSENRYTHVYPYYYVEDDGTQYLDDYILPTGIDASDVQQKVLMLDLTSEFKGMPTKEVLKSTAEKYIKEHDLNHIEEVVDTSFITLDKQSLIGISKPVLLGDVLSIKHPKLRKGIKLRCYETQYNVLTDMYESISLGDKPITLVDTLAKETTKPTDKDSKPGTTTPPAIPPIITDQETGQTYKWVVVARNGAPELQLIKV